MIFSIALILILGFLLSSLFTRLQLPGLLGLILTGILLGPYAMDLMAPELLAISADIRKIALIVILVRAGLTMDLGDLKKIGRPAVLMTFLPATFEILAVILLAPKLLGITLLEAAILGAVLGAVSPAVVVPRMIMLIESGYGKAKGIPQMILAGASVDDVYVIVLFTSFMGMYTGSGFQAITLLSVPVSIALGLLSGLLVGLGLIFLFRSFHIRDTMKVMLVLSACFLLVATEDSLAKFIPFSGLLGVMAVGATLLKRRPELAKRLNDKFAKIWSASGNLPVCFGRIGCRHHSLAWRWLCGCCLDFRRFDFPDDCGLHCGFRHKPECERTHFLRDGVYAESHRPGGHRIDPFGCRSRSGQHHFEHRCLGDHPDRAYRSHLH